ncbi:hypothetical protein DFH27DRAFT_579874 [Peziza echinospora]|nr:hypothetical protein DFH27DRAFT_579874 [Peziza echinospora]
MPDGTMARGAPLATAEAEALLSLFRGGATAAEGKRTWAALNDTVHAVTVVQVSEVARRIASHGFETIGPATRPGPTLSSSACAPAAAKAFLGVLTSLLGVADCTRLTDAELDRFPERGALANGFRVHLETIREHAWYDSHEYNQHMAAWASQRHSDMLIKELRNAVTSGKLKDVLAVAQDVTDLWKALGQRDEKEEKLQRALYALQDESDVKGAELHALREESEVSLNALRDSLDLREKSVVSLNVSLNALREESEVSLNAFREESEASLNALREESAAKTSNMQQTITSLRQQAASEAKRQEKAKKASDARLQALDARFDALERKIKNSTPSETLNATPRVYNDNHTQTQPTPTIFNWMHECLSVATACVVSACVCMWTTVLASCRMPSVCLVSLTVVSILLCLVFQDEIRLVMGMNDGRDVE